MQFTQTKFNNKSLLIHDFIRTTDTDLHQVDLEFDLNASKMDQITVQYIEEFGLLEVASLPITT